MQRRIAEIIDARYEVYGISCEPSEEEIADAIAKGELEERGFQKDLDLLNAEWNSKANSREEYCSLQRQVSCSQNRLFCGKGLERLHSVVTRQPNQRRLASI